MKQYMNRLLTIAAVLLASAGAWAGEVTIIVTPNNAAGTVVASQASAGQTCTITVTPASGYYLTVENLTAVTTLDGGGMQAPMRRDIGFSDETLTITPTNADADPSGVTTYTFTMPADEYINVEVTAGFQSLITISPSVTLTGWTYGENPNTPEVDGNIGKGEETFTYAVKGTTNFSETVPTDAGEYTVKASVAAINKYAAGEATADFTISKATITPSVTLQDWTFGTTANTPVVSGNTGDGQVTYTYATKGGTSYSAIVPSAAGDYTVKATIAETANYQGSEVTADFTIGKATAIITKAPTAISNIVYTGQPQALITAGEAEGGELQYKLGEDGIYSTEIPTATESGFYFVYYKVVADANHTDLTEDFIKVGIGQTAATLTKEPVAISNLIYTGEAQTLVTAGEANGGEVLYKLGADGTYGTEVPTAIDADTYSVYYKVVGDENHTDVAEAYVDVTISKAAITPTVTLAGWTYGGNANTPSVTGNTGDGEVTYTYRAENVAEYTETLPNVAGNYIVMATIAETDNYLGGEAVSEFTIAKADFANVTITEIPSQVFTGQSITPSVVVIFNDEEVSSDEYSVAYTDNVNAGEATVTLTSTGKNFLTTNTKSVNFLITAAEATIIAENKTVVYNGEPQPYTDASVDKGEVIVSYYATEEERSKGSNKLEDVPLNAGIYYIQLTQGDANYVSNPVNVTYTISKAAITPTVILESWVVGSEPNEPEVEGNLGEGDVVFSYKQIDAEAFTTEVPSAAGNYIVKAVIAETDNYFGGEVTAEFSIVNKTLVAEEVFVNNNTYATYYNSQEDILLPEGVVAYVVTGVNGSTLTTQALSYIPQDTPVLLEKNDGIVTRNDEITDNLLIGSATGVEVNSITNGVVYVLYNNQFVKSISGTIPVGRAYLVLDTTAGAPACLFFDFNDSTGINVVTINVNEGMTDADWYTLDGRKLHQKPSKNGLYIKNGKKIVIK